MTEFKVVGKRLPLKDAPEKATGHALYTGDMKLPGMLYGKILRSPYAHARVVSVDTSQAEKLPGVKAVLSKNNAPRVKVPVSQYSPRDKVAFGEKVRYIGDEVAAVAAVSPEIAEQALRLIKVEYEELPAIFDFEATMEPGAPLIHEDKENNIAGTIKLGNGDVEAGFREADYVFEETFRTASQRHASMETHCAIASFDPGGRLIVWTPTQLPFQIQKLLAEYLDIPMSMVRVIKPYFGGGFGSKLDMLVEHICALLSRKTGRPVRIVLSRDEEFTSTVSRHEYAIRMKIGVKKDGTLTAIQTRIISNEGAYMIKPGPGGVAAKAIIRTYRCPNTQCEVYQVYTNLLSGGAFRGYGAPQAHLALESMMDIIAEKLGIDPCDFRIQTHNQEGDPSFADIPMKTCGLSECLAKGKEHIGWARRDKPGSGAGVKKRGIGMACFEMGTGPSGTKPSYSAASILINADGTVHMTTGVADLGTGVDTTLAQIAAEELGVTLDDVSVISGDTGTASFDEGAYASMSLYNGGSAVRAAAVDAKRKVILKAAEQLEVEPEALEFKDGRIYVKATPEKGITYREVVAEAARAIRGNAAFIGAASFANTVFPPSFGAQFAEVEVDTETGQVEVLKIAAFQDNGTVINPMVVEGQLEGALQQATGYALTEDPIYDKSTGRMLNPSFHNYMVMTSLDMPHLDIGLVESNEPSGPFGAKGMSELPMNGVAPAIANAIYNATGVRLTEIPMIAERVYRALKDKK